MMNGYNDILDGGDYDHSSASTAYDRLSMFQIGMGEGEGQSCSSSMNRCSIVRQTTWVCYKKNLLLVFCILNIQCQIYYAEV